MSWVRVLTWLSQAVRGKFFHATERWAEPVPLLLVAKGVDHPNTHAGEGEKEQHSGCEHRLYKNIPGRTEESSTEFSHKP